MNRDAQGRLSRGPLFALAALVAAIAVIGVGCTDDTGTKWDDNASPEIVVVDEPSTTDGNSSDDTRSNAKVVASTTWIGALAKAAGATDVEVIAPADLQHQSDYDPKPSDLALLADADYVLLAGFEGFADRLTEAAGSKAEVIQVEAVNAPDTIRAEVTKLAELFGTNDRADEWLDEFDDHVKDLQSRIEAARPSPAPKVLAHTFMQPWVAFAGAESVGTFGPAPVTAAQLADLIAGDPDLVFDNAHVPSGATLDDLDVPKVAIINFPSSSLDLVEVFDQNTDSIVAAFEQLGGGPTD